MTTTQELLKSSFELNLNNYGPEDVERLNDWAIKAYAALETAQAENAQWRVDFKEMVIERNAALARLAITEEANSMLLARNKWLEHTLEVAGASPVEPSQAREEDRLQKLVNDARESHALEKIMKNYADKNPKSLILKELNK